MAKTLKKHSPSFSRAGQDGFTLIEAAIVLIIGGMIVAALTSGLLNYMRDSKIKTTRERLDRVDVAIREYLAANHVLPCPSSPTVLETATNYATSTLPGACASASGTVLNNGVRIGMVPTRTLGLPDEYGYDAWETRFIYAVTQDLTSPATYKTQSGRISIVDPAGASAINPPNTGNFVVVSTGGDKKGGYTASGAQIPCTSTIAPGQMDEENCDADSTFRVSQINILGNTNHYDDHMRYMGVEIPLVELPEGSVLAFDSDQCPDQWSRLLETAGRYIIGAGRYNHKAFPEPAVLGTYPGSGGGEGTWITTSPGGTAAPNMPPYVALTYCIRDVPGSGPDFSSITAP